MCISFSVTILGVLLREACNEYELERAIEACAASLLELSKDKMHVWDGTNTNDVSLTKTTTTVGIGDAADAIGVGRLPHE